MTIKLILTALVLLAVLILVLVHSNDLTPRRALIVGLLGILWLVLLVVFIIALIWALPLE